MNRKNTVVAVCLLALLADAIVFRQTLKVIDGMSAVGAATAFATQIASAIVFAAAVVAAFMRNPKKISSAARRKAAGEGPRPLRRLFSEVWS